MAKLAIRVTSDRTNRETVVTGDESITIGVNSGNENKATIEVNEKGELRVWHSGDHHWNNQTT